MKGFYNVTDKIKDKLLNDPNVNTVTFGDITKIDLAKQTIFPLSHIMVNSVTNEDNVLRFNLSIFSMDMVDQSKEPVVDIFRGNDNEQDVFNTQLSVVNKLIQILRGGDLHQDLYQLEGNPNLEPFTDRFENEVAGWTATFDLLIKNDIAIC